MILDVEEIKKILPHRYPFLFVDRVIDFDRENKSIKIIKNVSANEPIFNGHFPELAVFPGVLQIEMLAQACGILSFLIDPSLKENNALNLLVKTNEMKFKALVKPGDQIIGYAKVLSVRGPLWNYEAKAFRNTEDDVASEGLISCYQKILDSNK